MNKVVNTHNLFQDPTDSVRAPLSSEWIQTQCKKMACLTRHELLCPSWQLAQVSNFELYAST